MSEIVKVQVPLDPPDAPPLIYAEGRSRVTFASDLPDHVWKALGDKPRAFFNGDWDAKNKCWVLGEPCAEQAW